MVRCTCTRAVEKFQTFFKKIITYTHFSRVSDRPRRPYNLFLHRLLHSALTFCTSCALYYLGALHLAQPHSVIPVPEIIFTRIDKKLSLCNTID